MALQNEIDLLPLCSCCGKVPAEPGCDGYCRDCDDAYYEEQDERYMDSVVD